MTPGPAQFIDELKKRKDLRDVVHHEVIEAVEASYGRTSRPLSPLTIDALRRRGIVELYCHQAEGVDLIRQGKNVVVMTPAASGKSLIYNIPVIEKMLEDPESRALYLFPLKGLEQDQMYSLKELCNGFPTGSLNDEPVKKRTSSLGIAEIYDGDTSDYRRKKIRENPPRVVLTNPDMLHLAMLPFHEKWKKFFSNLNYIVIDEVHTYRGVFGSHVAHILRRLLRIAALYGSAPQIIASSATIENPQELAWMLTGADFELVRKSGAPVGKRNFIFINPAPGGSPHTVSTRLFIACVNAGFKTIAFTKARKVTELMYRRVIESVPALKNTISSYRAGFLPEERRIIERRLFNDELMGVISTSALELGVDIGGLDACVLVGYPGTISSTWQRAGRAGRKGQETLIVMVAITDALDQYFMRNPADFFARSAEAAVLDAENRQILKSHLRCAAAESPLKQDDRFYDVRRFTPLLDELQSEEKLRFWLKGRMWYPRGRYPHPEVSIRSSGNPYSIVLNDGTLLGQSGTGRIFHELHPGAIYLHRGVRYRVTSLDTGTRRITCATSEDTEYYTRPISNEESEIVSIEASKKIEGVTINLGTLRVTEKVIGYRKKNWMTDENMGEFTLDLPPTVFTTTGIWMKADEAMVARLKSAGISGPGSLHAVEHAMIATLPLFALCDRMDLGGVSYEFNEELESPAIFIYDGHPGGVGLAKRGFEKAREWFSATVRLMEECPCEIACPSCTQDPKCGNNNEPLDKRGAIAILKDWIS